MINWLDRNLSDHKYPKSSQQITENFDGHTVSFLFRTIFVIFILTTRCLSLYVPQCSSYVCRTKPIAFFAPNPVMRIIPTVAFLAAAQLATDSCALATTVPVHTSKGIVVSQNELASAVGVKILRAGGNAVDAAIATAFALAVTHPAAGNIGGGGYIVYRPATGEPITYDFRETAPAKAAINMFLNKDGNYDPGIHHHSHRAVGVPGTVAGLYLAWKENGRLPWKQLVQPAVGLARDGFLISAGLAQSLKAVLPDMRRYPASVAQFSRSGVPYAPGERLRQDDLARTLARIAENGPKGFYEGKTAALVEREMLANEGLITRDDLKAYQPKRRAPVRGTYRGCEIISMPPSSSGGTALIEMLNILEGYDLRSSGFGSAQTVHLVVEAMRRVTRTARATWVIPI